MEDLITRTGGESETRAGKLIPSFVIDTAGAPASATAPGEKAGAAPEWIELLPAVCPGKWRNCLSRRTLCRELNAQSNREAQPGRFPQRADAQQNQD